MAIDDRAHLEVTDIATWRAWLATEHATAAGVWVVTYKKGAGRPSPGYDALRTRDRDWARRQRGTVVGLNDAIAALRQVAVERSRGASATSSRAPMGKLTEAPISGQFARQVYAPRTGWWAAVESSRSAP